MARRILHVEKETVLEAISGSAGVLTRIARKLGVAWDTARKLVNRWEETRIALQEEREIALDMAEVSMFDRIKNGDGPMIRFYLRTQGKDRGYFEREEVAAGEGMGQLVIVRPAKKKTDEEETSDKDD